MSVHTSHSFCLIPVEFGVSDLNILLLSVYDFCESWLMEVVLLLQAGVKSHLHVHQKPSDV
jgi:hypothetical protein